MRGRIAVQLRKASRVHRYGRNSRKRSFRFAKARGVRTRSRVAFAWLEYSFACHSDWQKSYFAAGK
jgi:hypothetical protein